MCQSCIDIGKFSNNEMMDCKIGRRHPKCKVTYIDGRLIALMSMWS